METLVILNPTAGGGVDPEEFRRRLRRTLEAELAVTGGPGEAAELAAAAARAGCPCVVAAGGDGTVAEVASSLYRAGGKAMLGLIPVGTGNDLARSLGIPLQATEAARVVAAGRSRVLDLIRADTEDDRSEFHLVTNAAVAGFAGRIGESMSAAFRRRWRHVAYLIAALRQLGDLRPYDARIEADGRCIEERILMAIVANSRFAGGKIPFAPAARTDDGWLDVVLIRAQPVHRVAALVPRILRGRHVADPGVRTLRASEIRLESDPAMWINLDGETWHAAPSRFRVLPSVLRVLAP